jgi:membrane protein DedA with SNARE-associated domain
MEDTLTSLATYGYIILFLYSFGGGFFAIVGAGVLSYAGKMDLTTSMAVAFTSNMLGDMFLFYLARYQKHEFHNFLLKHRRKIALAHVYMKKYGSFVVFIQKYVYGIKTVVPIAIGLTKYDMRKFMILNVFASALWVLVFGLASYYSGEYLLKGIAYATENPIVYPIFIGTILTLVVLFFKSAEKKKK